MIDLRLGRWQDVLADVDEVDAVLSDPPYSERTHRGHDDTGSLGGRSGLAYRPWSAREVFEFVGAWSSRCRGWMCCLTDHVLVRAYEEAFGALGRYVFAPLPVVTPGGRVRLAGDGPSCWSVYLMVARPKTQAMARWGTLPGHYLGPPERGLAVCGGKPLWLMGAIVRDYSLPGGLVCDPCAGGATTLLAAAIEGRRAIGAEMDPNTHRLATERIAAGWTPAMFSVAPPRAPEQPGLL